MVKISTSRIPQKKKKIIALITNYFLMVVYLICRVFTLRFPCKKDGSTLNLREMQKVLVIRADGLGDVVMSTPFFAQLREIFPNSDITLLAATASKELVEPISVFDKIIYFDLPWFFKGQKQKLTKLLRLIAAMRKDKFDLAIDIRGDFRNNILMYLANAKYRLGFGITGCGFLLSHAVTIPENSHMVTASLSLIEYLNPQDHGEHRLRLWITKEDRNFADRFLKTNGLDPAEKNVVVTIHPGAKWHGRKWAPENYARIADSLIDTYHAVVVLAGSADDVETVKEIALLMDNKPAEAAGKTSLTQLLALLEKSVLFLGVDSGPVHMATAMGIKTIALYGPAKKEAVGPWGENCIVLTEQDSFACCPCTQIKCLMPGKSCMDAITAESVWTTIDDYLSDILSEQTMN